MERRSIDINRWAEIVVKEWIIKVQDLEIYDSFALADSFAHHVFTNSDGNINKVMFLFNYYGKFAEMGVGRSFSIDWANSPVNKRKQRPWYTNTFRAQVHRLRELLQEKYVGAAGRIFTSTITETAVAGDNGLKGMGDVDV